MKVRKLLLLYFSLVGFLAVSQKPIYLNFVSHNETSDPLDYANSKTDFDSILPIIESVCDTIKANDARYNMMVDANFIFGCLHHQNAANSHFDILERASASAQIEVDGHNHFSAGIGPGSNPYNQADLAKLLDSCGVVLAKKILGGVTYMTASTYTENWTQYSVPIKGYTFTDYEWTAEAIWGTSTPGYVADYEAWGMFRPAGATPSTFFTHDPNGSILSIGGGCKNEVSMTLDHQTNQFVHTTSEIIANIKQMSDNFNLQPASSDEFYGLNIMMNFRDFTKYPSIADSISTIIHGLQDYVQAGKIVWATLGEKIDYWNAAHPSSSDYFNVECDATIVTETDFISIDETLIYPNPTSSFLQIQAIDDLSLVEIFDLMGQKVYSDMIQGKTLLDLNTLPKGNYLLMISNSSETETHQFVKM